MLHRPALNLRLRGPLLKLLLGPGLDLGLRPRLDPGNLGGFVLDHLALDLAPGFTASRSHEALVEAGVLRGRVLDEERRDVVVERDLDALFVFLDGSPVVEELELRLVAGRELDVEPDVVSGRHGHLLQASRRSRRRLQHVLLPRLDDVQIRARLGRAGNVLDDATEDAGVIRASLQDRQGGLSVLRDDLDVVVGGDREAVAIPLGHRGWVTDELDGELGLLALGHGDRF